MSVTASPERKAPIDLVLLSTIIVLVCMSLLVVYSASAVLAERTFGDSFYFLKRQAIFAALGFAALAVTLRMNLLQLRRWAFPLYGSGILLMIAVLIPGIGVVRGGARSWLGIGSLGVQPSEYMKLAIVIFIASFVANLAAQQRLTSWWNGLAPTLLLIAIPFALIMLQPDLGSGAVLVGGSMFIVFAAGARPAHLGALALAGLAGFAALVAAAPYRLKRITGFLNPWSDPLGTGYQIIQSFYAIGPGGWSGLGYGMSRQKYSYLPEPQTDFIFAIIAEEFGFIGGTVVIVLFMVIIWRGFRIAIRTEDRFGALLAVGITSIIVVQVSINIGVVIGVFPVTGITLPLLSYGGSSLTLLLVSMGILLNLSKSMR